MTRRLTAMLGLLILIALVAGLVWGVWRHSRSGRFDEEQAVVTLDVSDTAGLAFTGDAGLEWE